MPKTPKLKSVRERNFISQQDLADKAGVSKTTIVRLESGQVEARFVTIRKLAAALGVAPQELV